MMALMLAYSVAVLGCAMLALGMDRHQPQLAGRVLAAGPGQGARCAGAALLLLSLWVCVAHWQASVGAAMWLGVVSFAALTLGLGLSYASQRGLLAVLGLAAFAAVTCWAAMGA